MRGILKVAHRLLMLSLTLTFHLYVTSNWSHIETDFIFEMARYILPSLRLHAQVMLTVFILKKVLKC